MNFIPGGVRKDRLNPSKPFEQHLWVWIFLFHQHLVQALQSQSSVCGGRVAGTLLAIKEKAQWWSTCRLDRSMGTSRLNCGSFWRWAPNVSEALTKTNGTSTYRNAHGSKRSVFLRPMYGVRWCQQLPSNTIDLSRTTKTSKTGQRATQVHLQVHLQESQRIEPFVADPIPGLSLEPGERPLSRWCHGSSSSWGCQARLVEPIRAGSFNNMVVSEKGRYRIDIPPNHHFHGEHDDEASLGYSYVFIVWTTQNMLESLYPIHIIYPWYNHG